jgi:hypothetical protein
MNSSSCSLSSKRKDSSPSKTRASQTHCSKWPLTPTPHFDPTSQTTTSTQCTQLAAQLYSTPGGNTWYAELLTPSNLHGQRSPLTPAPTPPTYTHAFVQPPYTNHSTCINHPAPKKPHPLSIYPTDVKLQHIPYQHTLFTYNHTT